MGYLGEGEEIKVVAYSPFTKMFFFVNNGRTDFLHCLSILFVCTEFVV